jgi:hypothetical protein
VTCGSIQRLIKKCGSIQRLIKKCGSIQRLIKEERKLTQWPLGMVSHFGKFSSILKAIYV